jgi:hypothetical protein
VDEDRELAAKATGEVAGHVVDVFVEKSGLLEPARALANGLVIAIDAALWPKLIAFSMKAAARIERTGLARRAIDALPPRLLRGILEGGAEASDETMRDRWEALLTNVVVVLDPADVKPVIRVAFPTILSELEPHDAALLDTLFADIDPTDPARVVPQLSIKERASLDNLARLELVRYTGSDTPTLANGHQHPEATTSEVVLTALGFEFLQACRPPGSPD